MNFSSRWQIAFLTSSLAALITSLLLFGLRGIVFSNALTALDISLIIVLVFATVCALNYIIVEHFAYERVKDLYTTIHHLKAGKQMMLDKSLRSNEVLEMVEEEVLEYSQNKLNEVEELRRLEKYRREFLGDVSHELKTPIFNVQGYLHTLLDGGLEDDRINRNYLIKSAKNIDRLEAIVQDLLLISQYEAGELELVFEQFDILDLITEVFETLELKADLKDIDLKFSSEISVDGQRPNRRLIVWADRNRISQVLFNLISNSINYGTDDGFTEVNIKEIDSQHYLFEVTDNGPGIEAQHLNRLFQRFYRVDKHRSRDSGGTGLGLAIVKHIIEAHKESISVQSKVDEGTTFSFTLRKG